MALFEILISFYLNHPSIAYFFGDLKFLYFVLILFISIALYFVPPSPSGYFLENLKQMSKAIVFV